MMRYDYLARNIARLGHIFHLTTVHKNKLDASKQRKSIKNSKSDICEQHMSINKICHGRFINACMIISAVLNK